MSDRKTCVRCERPIDRYARTCVYCNWDQAETAPPPIESTSAPAYVAPADHRARNRILGIVALIGVIIIAFVVGTLIHGFEPNEVKAAPNKQTTATAPANTTPGPKSNVTLVPATDAMTTPTIEPPVTSAPPHAPGQMANDATALPSDAYASVAAKAKAHKEAAAIDPRSLRGRAYEEEPAPRPVRSREEANVIRTEAFPEYKPLPNIHVDRDTTAKIALTVGADGSVKDVEILNPIPGATPQLVSAVQNWRFRPATINGTPVPAKVTVTITLRGNE